MKKLIFGILCLFAVSASQIYAMEATFDRDTHKVTISGKAGNNEHIAIVITDETISKLSEATTSMLEAHSIGFYETNADADGKYSISVGATKSEGWYNFFVSGADTQDECKEELYKKTDIDSALTTLSAAAATGEAQILKELNDEHFRKVIGLNEVYNRLSDKSVLAAAIAQKSSYNSYAELNSAVTAVQTMQDFCDKVNAMINKVQVKDLITELQGIYGGDGAVYTKYFGLQNTDYIDGVIFGKKPYGTISAIYDAFAVATNEYNEIPIYSGGIGGGSGGSGGTGGFGTIIPFGGTSANVNSSENGLNNAGGTGDTNSVQTFSDVAPDYWGYNAIEELYKMGIISGVNSDEFAPDESIRREEFVKMLVMLTGLKTDSQQDTFTDTDKAAWYSPYLAIAQECGLAFGKEDGSFGVGEVLTREDMAVLAARVLGSTERGVADEFTDEYEISNYARNSVAILCGLKVMNGMGDGSFAPKETATRAQAAKVIYEIAKIVK